MFFFVYLSLLILLPLCRFSQEAKQQRSPYCYLPFGTGPRSCIGMRFALMEAKMALVHLLKRFKFQRSADTEVYLLKNYMMCKLAHPINFCCIIPDALYMAHACREPW